MPFLILAPACAGDHGVVQPHADVPLALGADPPATVRAPLPDYYFEWETQAPFALGNEGAVCDPAFEFLENGVIAFNETISGSACTQYTVGTFLVRPRSGSATNDPISLQATATHERQGSGSGCSTLYSVKPFRLLIETCGPENSGDYAVELLTNARYRIETNAQAHYPGSWYRSRFTLNLTGPTPPPIAVDLVVKPGDHAPAVQCASRNALMAVAILGSDDFDVADVDATSVRFGRTGAEAAESHRNGDAAQRHDEDVDRDGDMDLVLHFRFAETGFSCSDIPADARRWGITAHLAGLTAGGAPLAGETAFDLLASPGRR